MHVKAQFAEVLFNETFAGIRGHECTGLHRAFDFAEHFFAPEHRLTVGREGIEEYYLVLRGRLECEDVFVAFVQEKTGQNLASLVPSCAVYFFVLTRCIKVWMVSFMVNTSVIISKPRIPYRGVFCQYSQWWTFVREMWNFLLPKRKNMLYWV